MKQYLQSIFGYQIKERRIQMPEHLPVYLKMNYEYHEYEIEGIGCIFVIPIGVSFVEYKKQFAKIQSFFKKNIVLQLKSVTAYQRKTLIENKISFVIEDIQVYLPFMAISLVDKYMDKKEIEVFSPITQLVFLYHFYNKKSFLVAELAALLQYTEMSICRAYKELVDSGLFVYEKDGRKKYLRPQYEGGELLRAAENYFINPIIKTIYLKNNIQTDDFLVAGVYALSQKGMLNANQDDICYATSKTKRFPLNNMITKAEFLLGEGIKLEQWAYNPRLLSIDGTVDDISLVLSLEDVKDERVLFELDEIRRKYQW